MIPGILEKIQVNLKEAAITYLNRCSLPMIISKGRKEADEASLSFWKHIIAFQLILSARRTFYIYKLMVIADSCILL